MKSSFTEDFDDYDSRSRGFANGRHGQTDSMYNMRTNKSTIEDHKGDLDDLDDQFYMHAPTFMGNGRLDSLWALQCRKPEGDMFFFLIELGFKHKFS